MFGIGQNKSGENNLKDFLDVCPIASVILKIDGEIAWYNSALLNLFGEKISECKYFADMIGYEADFAAIVQQVNSANSNEIKIDTNLKDEAVSSVRVIIKEIDKKHVPDGSDAKYFINVVDMEEHKSLEQKLNQSQKMQAVGQLAGGIAHDFNNLLTAMSGFCDLLLQKHPPGDRSFPDIMQIKQNVNRAANLVRQLLAFSRKQVLKPKVIDITDVLSELSNLLRRLLGESVKLEMKHGRDLGKILADAGQIDQVTINLAVNARDAMKNGGTLKIETSNFSLKEDLEIPDDLYSPDADDKILAGDYVLVTITDTGTGIPRETLEQIFEPFFSTKEVGAGTGLGLATVYGIVKQTDGYILVKSIEGEGTEFQIYFKRHEGEVESDADSPKDVVQSKVGVDLSGEGTILLVEDEVPVRIFASRALGNKGYTVIEADNAEDGLKLVEEQGSKIDLIVSDVIMPGMSGPEMVKVIEKDNPDIKVIFMSGYAEDAFVDYYDDVDKLNFLAKPFTLKDLAAMVKDVMNK